MEWLQSLYENSQLPVLTAFVLGLMTALSPCPLAMNITAVAYLGKDISSKRAVFINGLVYTLGRAITYTGLGMLFYFGASKFEVSRFFQYYGERTIGFLLILIGVIMLDVIRIKLPSFQKVSERIAGKGRSWFTALLLGILFALAFCPSSGIFFFGLLIPMTISSSDGLYLPLVFAIGTGLPVIIVSYLLSFTVSGIGKFFNRITAWEKWVRRLTAAVFIVVGVYYIITFYLL